MAYYHDSFCYRCDAFTPHTNTACNVCTRFVDETKLDQWKKQSTNEKLLDLHKRLLQIEKGPNVIT